jgi:DnaJ-class molecular chaperone
MSTIGSVLTVKLGCPECEGKGVFDPCPHCHGEGSVEFIDQEASRLTAPPGDEVWRTIQCERCFGDGMAECRMCQATGTIRVDPDKVDLEGYDLPSDSDPGGQAQP